MWTAVKPETFVYNGSVYTRQPSGSYSDGCGSAIADCIVPYTIRDVAPPEDPPKDPSK
jgi:hypothetical protein